MFGLYMDVIVLAGGFGTRLRPWTSHMPKPLVPILDRAMIEHVVDVLPESVVTRVLIAAGYGIEKMRIHFEEMSLPYEVVIVEETEPLGTGGAIANCRPHLSGGTVCVINGDLLTSLQVEKMLIQHREDGNSVTISLWEVEDPSRFGVADFDSVSRKIQRFQEKPPRDEAYSNLINAGTYLIEPELFDEMPLGRFSIERDLYPHVAESGRLGGFPFEGWFVDAGTPPSYIEAVQASIRHGRHRNGKIERDNWTLSAIHDQVIGSSISDDVVISGNAEVISSAILNGCKIEEGSRIKDCMIGSGSVVSKGAKIEGVVVDFDVIVPENHIQNGGRFPPE